MKYKQYRRKKITELRPYEPGEVLDGVAINVVDQNNGSPKAGDMIARNPINHSEKWLVSKKAFEDNFEDLEKVVDEMWSKAGLT
jgi:hypothetical protein